ncbi:MAG TPA: leucine-rich repeat domain-containing protein, partial [Trueperaceae bacterium]|nr:leucine-rich repeat domain-containing protein [Trueperaceae bacterium]
MKRLTNKIVKKAIWQKGALAILFILLFLILSACGGKAATKDELVADKNLQKLIRTTLALSEEHKITIDDLKKLKTLKCDYCDGDLTQEQKIISLLGLEHATNLEDLELQYNKISDITALANLKKLSKLYLHDNDISDISVLSGLTNLKSLWILQNRITDVSALSKLINLQHLDIAFNKISD